MLSLSFSNRYWLPSIVILFYAALLLVSQRLLRNNACLYCCCNFESRRWHRSVCRAPAPCYRVRLPPGCIHDVQILPFFAGLGWYHPGNQPSRSTILTHPQRIQRMIAPLPLQVRTRAISLPIPIMNRAITALGAAVP